jgi:hypothetical protein
MARENKLLVIGERERDGIVAISSHGKIKN